MIVKVCGITKLAQLKALDNMGVEMVGLNFYRQSKRFVNEPLMIAAQKSKRVGVFVNPTISEVSTMVSQYTLDVVQLHGHEPVELVSQLSTITRIIKAFGISKEFDFSITGAFEPYIDYFLFDTKTPLFGGSGKKFNWQKLEEYKGSKPFLLSGGIQPTDAEKISNLYHEKFVGVDINSGFEDSPGIKNIELIKKFLLNIEHEKSR